MVGRKKLDAKFSAKCKTLVPILLFWELISSVNQHLKNLMEYFFGMDRLDLLLIFSILFIVGV